jgi:hypothetical protein
MPAIDLCSRMMILAPVKASCPHLLLSRIHDGEKHARLFDEMQKVRARVMLREGAISGAAIDPEGRYTMPGDDQSWHIVKMRDDGAICGCARILVHPRDVRFEDLRVATCRGGAHWDPCLRDAVERELLWARYFNLLPIEPGGWALDDNARGTGGGIGLAVAAFAWARLLGECFGFLTATVKHCSATMLRRLGGTPLRTAAGTPVPEYWDERWGTGIEVLRFDTNSLDQRFHRMLDQACNELMRSPVIFRKPSGSMARTISPSVFGTESLASIPLQYPA